MSKIKTLGYDWECGHEELVLTVDAYACNKHLYIGLGRLKERKMEEFCDLTVNLPGSSIQIEEAYIQDFCSDAKLDFIRKHRLGKVLSEMGYSGISKYAKVSFDLERLAEFDKEGVERYKRLHGIS